MNRPGRGLLPRDLDDNAKLEEAPAGAIDASFRLKELLAPPKEP